MKEVHKAVLKGKRVHNDEIIPVPDKIRDRNIPSTPTLLHTPPSHPAPLAYPIPYPLTQKIIFVILTSPGSLAYTLVPLFFGW